MKLVFADVKRNACVTGMQRVGVPQMMSNSMDKKRPAGPSDMK